MSSVARTALRMLGVCVCLSVAQAHIWAWMLAMPYTPPEGGPLRHREREPESLPLSHKADSVACEHDRACGKGFSCDRHFGRCVPLRQEGQFCRRDAQCVRSLHCMFGKCLRSIPGGQEGARCKVDRDCGSSMCCARHHGEQVCKRKLAPGEGCFVPDGGLAFSINQVCPCDEGLLCQGGGEPPRREREFVYSPEPTTWTCQASKP
ncbi:dickkopf-related protein 3-like [Clupea harengus]|uniref:Dickkopf-related protein 3-like n=1 Tax=Clupea harengus TaxID=7950 RepID=A0A6P3W3U1_CLUHA|nr:dickkopf-related protein 3-like [Clupea harengus]